MNRKTLLIMAMLIPVVVVSAEANAAPSNIDPTDKFSWSENVGWMNWRDANGGADGVLVDTDFLSGYVWMENVGWINLGDGTPTDGMFYANLDGTDFGVNIDPGTNDLFGLAWGENVGWINFDTPGVSPDQARYDVAAHRFRGYAWGENIGWINLDDPVHFLGTITNAPASAPAPHDRRKNRYISFAPNNGSHTVAFRVSKTTVPGGSCWVQAPVTSGADINTAKCDAAPVFRVWTEPVIHVGDCEIIPVADYEVAATSDGAVFSSSLAVGTILLPALNSKLWGDAVGSNNGSEWTPPNQLTNVNDVLSLLAYISSAAIRPQFTVANLQAISAADSCLNSLVNTSDVLISVQAISGNAYGPPATAKFIDPALCPVCP